MLWLIAVFRITERSSRLHWCIDMWCHERTFRTRSYRFAVFFLGNLRVKIIIKKNNLQNFALTFLSPGVVSLNNSTELFVRRIYSPPPSTVATAADILFSSLLPLFYLTYSCLDVSQKLRFFGGGVASLFCFCHAQTVVLLFQLGFKGLSLSKACGWCRGQKAPGRCWLQSPLAALAGSGTCNKNVLAPSPVIEE